jgi:hypothetical protein
MAHDENGRVCTSCLVYKTWDSFHKNKGINGRRSVCAACTNKKERERSARYRNCPIKSREIKEKRAVKNLNSYGLSPRDYEKILAKQDNKCALCGINDVDYFEKYRQKFCIDHCHKTGEVRGLLCRTCNSGLGKLGDKSKHLYRAYKYLWLFENHCGIIDELKGDLDYEP